MNTFVSNLQTSEEVKGVYDASKTQTENGAAAYVSSLNHNVDLFARLGSARGQNLNADFDKAFREDPEIAVRQILWLRDIRGGAGERTSARNLFLHLEQNYEHVLARVIEKIPTWGRWDDLLVFKKTKFRMMAHNLIQKTLLEGMARVNAGQEPTMEQSLCAKWMPREKSNSKEKSLKAHHLRKHMKMDAKAYRQTLSNLTQVVENQMCAKQFHNISYKNVPSVAMLRYASAFAEKDQSRYVEYLTEAIAGNAKMNAGAVFPHEVTQNVLSRNMGRQLQAEAQWKNLPNYMNEKNVLVMVDLSSSMDSTIPGTTYTNKHVAISLAAYCASKNKGAFRGVFMSFAEEPTLGVVDVEGSLASIYWRIRGSQVGYTTNFNEAFDILLKHAKKHNVPQEEMPEFILVPSDMQFNEASGNRTTNFQEIRNSYEDAGYQMPNLVFWQMNGRIQSVPVRADTNGAVLVSGFSPAILKSVLSGESPDEPGEKKVKVNQKTPKQVMLETLLVDRYDWQ